MRVLVVSQEEIGRLLPMSECMTAMAEALGTLARGAALLPLRQVLVLPGGQGAFAVMPACLEAPPALGLKAITVFPGNHGTAFDSHQGAVLLFEMEHGSLRAVMDASAITAIRTAAVSGVATRLLARPDAGDLAILGTGVQAASHLEAMLLARSIRRVRAWSRRPESVARFAERARRRHGGLGRGGGERAGGGGGSGPRLHRHLRAGAGPAGRVDCSGSARERRRVLATGRSRAGHGSGGAVPLLCRPAPVGAQRGR